MTSVIAPSTAAGSHSRTGVSRRVEWSVPLAGLAGVSVLVQSPDALSVTVCAGIALAALVAWIVWQDLRTFTISDAALLTFAILAVALRWRVAREAGDSIPPALLATVFDGALPGSVLFLFRELYFRRKGFDGLGLGDVKLGAVGGLLVGLVGLSWALFAASLLGLVVVFAGRIVSKRTLDRFDRLAFGALLAPTLFLVWLIQQWSLPLPFIGF